MNPLKKLAGQTAIYGIPSIVGRILNYLLVPFYTRIFEQDEYGVVILMYSFIAIVFIILTYGMETSFFRFTELEQNKKRVYSTGSLSILFTTSVFLVLVLAFPGEIASWMKYPDHSDFVIWMGLILSLDVISAIPFARLRALNRPIRFASIKIINISVNIGFNVLFLYACPKILENYDSGILYNMASWLFNPEWDIISYVFISNLIASAVTVILLLPEILDIELKFDFALWRRMMVYAFPLLFSGLAIIMNETLSRILLRYLLPESIAEAEIGVFSACYKIAILMSLFIQAFRYAAEPFFFAHAREVNAKATYANVMKFFVIATAIIFLVLMFYLDLIILIIGEKFRGAVNIIPIVVLAYVFYGIYYNLTVWFKLTNNTRYGAMMAITGAVITIVFNYVSIPVIGILGSAWATFACYGSMMVLSYFLMRRFYPIKYDLGRILFYLVLAIGLYMISTLITVEKQWLQIAINSGFLLIYLLIIFRMEVNNLRALIKT